MSGSGLKIDWGGLDIMGRLTSGPAVARLKLAKDIGQALVSSTVERFSTGTDPEGTAWKPAARGGQTLANTGRLRNSIQAEVTPDYVIVGTNVKYARIHQEGGDIHAKKARFLRFMAGGKPVFRKKVTIPARPFMGISQDDLEEVGDLIDRHIKKMFRLEKKTLKV
ncbi:MAG: phage virion morphogenesis protein [Desulfarculales bacterium]|jgi:phage virion morphogenesis protein|nr:phage virion morphogenesis protein [Desulfarculales bacterium]